MKSLASQEADRILALPWRESTAPDDWSKWLRTPKGIQSLRPIQNRMLQAAVNARGLLAFAACGEGKTLASLLLPVVLRAERPLLLIPANLREQNAADQEEYAQNWKVKPVPVLSYEQLSSPRSLNKLKELKPDLIIADEAHYLRGRDSARSKRLGRYLIENASCRFAALSGTLMNRSLEDWSHLSDWALAGGAPIPRIPQVLDPWLRVLETHDAYGSDYRLLNKIKEQCDARSYDEAVGERIRRTEGVVVTYTQQVGASLRLIKRTLQIPEALRMTLEHAAHDIVSATQEMLDEETLNRVFDSSDLWTPEDAFAIRVWAQLVCGFFYIWDWEGEPDTDWVFARRGWGRACRWAREHLGEDSDALFAEKIEAGEIKDDYCVSAWETWKEHKHKDAPRTETVWVSDYLVDDVCAWFRDQKEPPIIWCGTRALAERISQRLSIPYYGAGKKDSQRLVAESKKAHPCVASIKAHATGKNLQRWSNQIVVHPLSSPNTWEQLLARTHRPGQLADEVTVTVYGQNLFGKALRRAKNDAQRVKEITGLDQRLTFCSFTVDENKNKR